MVRLRIDRFLEGSGEAADCFSFVAIAEGKGGGRVLETYEEVPLETLREKGRP